MNDNTITGIMGLGRPCERCGGTGTVHNGPWVVCCPECDGDGFYREPEDLSDQPEPDYPDIEPDFNELERQENARLDAIEDERDLKAYRAEHGDDAPDPKPQPQKVLIGRPLDLFEISFLRHLADSYGCQLNASEMKQFEHLCLDEGFFELRGDLAYLTPYGIQALWETEEKAGEPPVEYTLAQQLAAVTAERDKYKAQYEELHALRKQIWDMVMEADSRWQLTNDLYELLK